MKKRKLLLSCIIIGLCSLVGSNIVFAHKKFVNCAKKSLQHAINDAKAGTTIFVKGTCNENIVIKKNDLKLIGNRRGTNAIFDGENIDSPAMIKIESAVRVEIIGFDIISGKIGVHADAGASFKISGSNISNLSTGMLLTNNSNAKIENVLIENSTGQGTDIVSGSTAEVLTAFTISNSRGFGLELLDGSEMSITEGAVLTLSGNLLGAQVTTGSTLFVMTDGKINADNNILIGFSINTGASMFLFNADISANGNGLDGLDVVSSASLDIDGNSTLTANNNRREGISIDNGSINLFGFFSSEPNLPRIVANNNTNNGVQIEFGAKLDIGRNASIESMGNGKAGISLDDSSSANIHDSVITDNNGMLAGETEDDAKGPADFVVTFGSRVSFQGNNDVGIVLCDKSSMVRGDVQCAE